MASNQIIQVSLLTAAAINLKRVSDWLAGGDREKTRRSAFARVMQPLTAYSLIALIIESSRPGEFHPRFGAELGWQAVASPSSQSYTSRHPAQSRLSIPNHPKLVRGYSESYSDRLGCICGPSRRRATWDVLALRFAGRAFQQRIGFVARIAIPCF